MIYLYLNQNQIKTLFLKKSLFGQYEVSFSEKTFQVNLLENGQVSNVDILASAVKEVISGLPQKDKEIVLILPQESFRFLRTDIPVDIAPSAVNDFIYDKAKTSLSISLEEYFFDYFCVENGEGKKVNVYALSKNTFQTYQESFSLLGLKITNIIPETVSYFKLFDKTLRKERKENILYGHYDKPLFFAYLYDSYGLVNDKKLSIEAKTTKEAEVYLKTINTDFGKEGKKINRLILSGVESDIIRQDTFTKNAGAWTNPLKKIVTNFYQNYLKILVTADKKTFPILSLDACFGAFIFQAENKNFSLLKKNKNSRSVVADKTPFTFNKPTIKTEYKIFVLSFVASFIFFVLISKLNLNFKLPEINLKPKPTAVQATPTPLPPTPSPTPSFKKDALQIKVLNGGGVAGKASEVKTILKKAGYQEILTGNADNYDYKNTVIQVKKSVTDAYDVLKTDLKDYTTSIKKEILEESATADVIIIIGQDFK